MKIIIIVVSIMFVPFLLFSASQWWAARGVRVAEASCAWREDDLYVVTLRVRNTEAAHKLVSLRVQGNFRPPEGGRWPTPSVQSSYSATSQWTVVQLPPKGEAQQDVPFKVPGAEGFRCTAGAWVGSQERFAEAPDKDVTDAIKRSLR